MLNTILPYTSVFIENGFVILHEEKDEKLPLTDFNSMSPMKKMNGGKFELYEITLSFRMKTFRAMRLINVYGDKEHLEDFIDNFNKKLDR